MLERLQEKVTVWEALQAERRPIFLYGMGDGALKIMRVLERYQIPVEGIFASDEFVRGHSFAGFPVLRLQQVKEQYEDFVILLCFATCREEVLQRIIDLNQRYTLYAPDVPVCAVDEQVFDLDYLKAHEEALDRVYDCLADELSRKTLLHLLEFKISGKIDYLLEIATPMAQVYPTVICPKQTEHYVDLGAYRGDTVEEFLHYTDGQYASITAVEPDRRNFAKLQLMVEQKGLERVTLFQGGSYSHTDTLLFSDQAGRQSSFAQGAQKGKLVPVTSVDELLDSRPATLIKMDVEGAEAASIAGCAKTIARWHPKLVLSAYHKNEDIFALPLQVLSMRQDYRVFLRQSPYIPAWEIQYFLLPL